MEFVKGQSTDTQKKEHSPLLHQSPSNRNNSKYLESLAQSTPAPFSHESYSTGTYSSSTEIVLESETDDERIQSVTKNELASENYSLMLNNQSETSKEHSSETENIILIVPVPSIIIKDEAGETGFVQGNYSSSNDDQLSDQVSGNTNSVSNSFEEVESLVEVHNSTSTDSEGINELFNSSTNSTEHKILVSEITDSDANRDGDFSLSSETTSETIESDLYKSTQKESTATKILSYESEPFVMEIHSSTTFDNVDINMFNQLISSEVPNNNQKPTQWSNVSDRISSHENGSSAELTDTTVPFLYTKHPYDHTPTTDHTNDFKSTQTNWTSIGSTTYMKEKNDFVSTQRSWTSTENTTHIQYENDFATEILQTMLSSETGSSSQNDVSPSILPTRDDEATLESANVEETISFHNESFAEEVTSLELEKNMPLNFTSSAIAVHDFETTHTSTIIESVTSRETSDRTVFTTVTPTDVREISTENNLTSSTIQINDFESMQNATSTESTVGKNDSFTDTVVSASEAEKASSLSLAAEVNEVHTTQQIILPTENTGYDEESFSKLIHSTRASTESEKEIPYNTTITVEPSASDHQDQTENTTDDSDNNEPAILTTTEMEEKLTDITSLPTTASMESSLNSSVAETTKFNEFTTTTESEGDLISHIHSTTLEFDGISLIQENFTSTDIIDDSDNNETAIPTTTEIEEKLTTNTTSLPTTASLESNLNSSAVETTELHEITTTTESEGDLISHVHSTTLESEGSGLMQEHFTSTDITDDSNNNDPATSQMTATSTSLQY
ncbi:mucin-4-like [Uloborus diversus]|uniref:mucin-4-like n=1 Tax=Uloborus diversus TaxID=327109 RepID=UPI0024098D6B|nr:mucin-4-like [Uloborus diversus]